MTDTSNPKSMAGYLLARPGGLEGERGMAYDYILAGTGVFLEARNQLIHARVRIAQCQVRGLSPLTERVDLLPGLVPSYFLAQVLKAMRQDPHREVYLAVVWRDGRYVLERPQQDQSAAGVTYQPVPGTVVDFHSHGAMSARFSATDDRDDQGFRVSVVIGRVDRRVAEMAMRLGVYGYHAWAGYHEIFSGHIPTDLMPPEGG